MRFQIAFKRAGFRLLWYVPYQLKRQFFMWWLKLAQLNDVSNIGERWVTSWEEIYGVASYIHALHGFRYVWVAPQFTGLRVLDLACGSGYGSYYLSFFADSVVGVDHDPKAVQWAKEHFSRPNLKFMVGDALNLHLLPESFDVIVCVELIEHLGEEQQRRLLQQVSALKPKIFYLTTPNAELNSFRIMEIKQAKRYGKDKHHVGELFITELSSLLCQYFGDCKLFGQRLKNAPSYKKWLRICRGTVLMDDFEVREFDKGCSNILAICKEARI